MEHEVNVSASKSNTHLVTFQLHSVKFHSSKMHANHKPRLTYQQCITVFSGPSNKINTNWKL